MSWWNRAVLSSFAVLSLSLLVACGNSSNKATPPPTGAFSNSNLSGTYVFSIVGTDGLGDFLAMTGTFVANGTGGDGGITGGSIDINDTGFATPVRNNPITAGSYKVTADGRGQAKFATVTPFGNTITVDFVLSSSTHGLITQFDGNGTGSGSFDLQTSTSQPPAGTYILGLSGTSGINQVTGGVIPAAAAGAVILDSAGNTTGSLDFNNNATPSALAINSGNLSLGATGTATLVTGSGSLNFDVYPVDATHLKFIEFDALPILAGDLFLQTSSTFPSGTLAFTIAGLDYSISPAVPSVMGGIMTSDGTSISNGEEDFNDAGVVDSTPQAFSGSITASGARYAVQLSGFINGAGAVPATFTFAAYPSSGGLQLIEIDGGGVTAGVAFTQSSTTLASSQGYGLNLTAANGNGFEEDDIAEFTTTSTGFSGLIDFNDQGQTSFNQRLNGNYTMDSPATGRGVLTSNVFNGPFYVVDNSSVLFIETDSTQLGIGAFQVQNASASSNLAVSHLAMLRSKSVQARAWRHR